MVLTSRPDPPVSWAGPEDHDEPPSGRRSPSLSPAFSEHSLRRRQVRPPRRGCRARVRGAGFAESPRRLCPQSGLAGSAESHRGAKPRLASGGEHLARLLCVAVHRKHFGGPGAGPQAMCAGWPSRTEARSAARRTIARQPAPAAGLHAPASARIALRTRRREAAPRLGRACVEDPPVRGRKEPHVVVLAQMLK